jgi:hypothetical protein
MPKNTHASHIRITAAVQGFRRAGIAHSTEPTTYAVDDFSEEQLEQLHKEPRLVVEFVEAPEADQTDESQRSVGPDGVDAKLEDMTVAQLKEIAATGEIAGFSSMKKDALIEAIKLKRDWMGQ